MKAIFNFIITAIFFLSCTNPNENTTDQQDTSAQIKTNNKILHSAAPDSHIAKNKTITNDGEKNNVLQEKENSKPFSKTLKSGKVSFQVYSKNEEGSNRLKIRTEGFEIINDSFSHTINGKVTGAEVADLNKDGFPELYVFTSAANTASPAEIIAYGSNRNKSATPVYVKPFPKNNPALNNYKGGDNFYIKDNKLVREFANEGSDKITRVTYKLTRGETSLILEVDKVEAGL